MAPTEIPNVLPQNLVYKLYLEFTIFKRPMIESKNMAIVRPDSETSAASGVNKQWL